jgi:hypothetical protein
VNCGKATYWAYNALTFQDVMDESESVCDWFEPGRVAVLRKLVLRSGVEPDELTPIFKLPQDRKGRPLITESFLAAVDEASLQGLNPRLVI